MDIPNRAAFEQAKRDPEFAMREGEISRRLAFEAQGCPDRSEG